VAIHVPVVRVTVPVAKREKNDKEDNTVINPNYSKIY